MLRVQLDADEAVLAEPGAMVAMETNIAIETAARGGILGGIKRMLGGESFFVNTFRATGGAGEISFAPRTPGDLYSRELAPGEEFMLQSGAFVVSAPGVTLDPKWGGAKTFFGGEGLVLLKATGPGLLFFASYGSIEEIEVDGSYVADTGSIVAFTQGLEFAVQSVGGLKSLLFSGEGLVCRFTGRGRLYLQTRMPAPLAAFLNPFRPVKPKQER